MKLAIVKTEAQGEPVSGKALAAGSFYLLRPCHRDRLKGSFVAIYNLGWFMDAAGFSRPTQSTGVSKTCERFPFSE